MKKLCDVARQLPWHESLFRREDFALSNLGDRNINLNEHANRQTKDNFTLQNNIVSPHT